uniref:Uncharacterized protein n=1 Tax=Anguilla anguilla TaxID=7936 RepID=A0A0E9UHJ8_ANGAN
MLCFLTECFTNLVNFSRKNKTSLNFFLLILITIDLL